ncbi:MAG TPA: prenyltransferase/squalene oxidase repeat-containing protein [Tepidisphaeraceae bacterium]|nr:prenyltransferase/squalene oxidase repeat-containing protein [Tepidisphaeraceae bacterium]
MNRLFAVVIVFLAAPLAIAQAPATQPAAPAAVAPILRADTAIDLALLHLERRQHADGHFQSEPMLATTGLALTSFLATGHAPDVGRHGGTVRRAIDYLVRQSPADGYFGKTDGSRMYGQAIVVVALCQAYGLEQDGLRRAGMRAALAEAVTVILNAQNVAKPEPHAGGWRYEPASADSDLSVSAWTLIALCAARDIGLHVPDPAIANAAAYIRRCAHAERGGFAYQPAREPTAAMTAAGMLALSLATSGDAREIAAGAKVLREQPIGDATRFPFYAMYYANQAAQRVGGETWKVVSSAAQQRLLRTQLPSGAWAHSSSPEEPGEIYATAMAVLTLSVPQRVLPMYGR